MLKKLTIIALTFSLILFTAACSSDSVEPVAIVNGMEIARADYDTELEYELFSYAEQGYKLSDEEQEQVKEQVLDRLINNILLLEAASEAGITAESVDVDGEIDEIRSSFDDEEKFTSALEDSGFTLDEYRELVADFLIIEDLFEAELNLSAVEISDEEVQEVMADFMDSAGDEVADLDPEDVKAYLSYTLLEEKVNELKGEFIDELKENSEIEYFELDS